jgi:hypothetical protein
MTSLTRFAIIAALALVSTGGNARAQTASVAATERFAFHSDPWINLHHFLYHWAREEKGLGTGRQHVSVPERGSLAGLSAAERERWLGAVTFYRGSVAERSHFDPAMLRQRSSLAGRPADARTLPQDDIPGIGAALLAAMPVYQARWWPAHDRSNRAWIAWVVPRLRRHESRFVELTRRTHGANWPRERRRVDVSAYANARAGYTAEGWITIYSSDPGNQELYGLETILHEVQHARDVGSGGREALSHAFEQAGVEEPENLWHGIIFATAGEFLQGVVSAEGMPAHVPYWTRERFRELHGWREIVPAVEAHWLPVLRAETTQAQGFEALVQRFKPTGP